MDAIDIIGIILQLINQFIIVPIIIYGLYLFHQHRQHLITKYRNVLLVYTINILTVFAVCTERLWLYLVRVWMAVPAPHWTCYCFIAITWWGLMDLFAIKCYGLLYQQKYNTAIADIAWRKKINSKDLNWYISHKSTFGNTTYVIKLAVIPYIVEIIVAFIFFVELGETLIFYYVHSFFAVLPVLIAFYIVYKARALNDIYGIRNEILCQCILFIIALVMLAITSLHFHHFWDEYNPTKCRIEWLLHIPITYVASISLTIPTTFYPVYLCKKSANVDSLTTYNNNINHTKLQTMESALSDIIIFQEFAQYLVKEFSTENLLFIIDLVAIKYQYQIENNKLVQINVSDNDTVKHYTIDFSKMTEIPDTIYTVLYDKEVNKLRPKIVLPSNLPESDILINNDQFVDQMKAIYFKYIPTGSVHEINVSYQIKQELKCIFEDDNITEASQLFACMDYCAHQILILMFASFQRFVMENPNHSRSALPKMQRGTIRNIPQIRNDSSTQQDSK